MDHSDIDPALPAPNFFIVGAAKAGTTSLHAYLSDHPQVFMSALKEPHYFATFDVSDEFDNFMPVIRQRDAYQELFRGSEALPAVGEASPSYLCDTYAAKRIRQALPHAKIIISLRNPVDRAFSHYLMDFYEGREKLPFREAIAYDMSRKVKGWGQSAQYVELGLYADQVKRYLDEFGRDRVMIVLFEELVRDTRRVMSAIATFLEIDPLGYGASAFQRVHNPFEKTRGPIARAILRFRPLRVWSKRIVPHRVRTAVRDSFLFERSRKPELDPGVRQTLATLFARDVERLEQLLGRDLSVLKS